MQNVFPFSVPKSEDHPTNNFTVDIKLDLKRESQVFSTTTKQTMHWGCGTVTQTEEKAYQKITQ